VGSENTSNLTSYDTFSQKKRPAII